MFLYLKNCRSFHSRSCSFFCFQGKSIECFNCGGDHFVWALEWGSDGHCFTFFHNHLQLPVSASALLMRPGIALKVARARARAEKAARARVAQTCLCGWLSMLDSLRRYESLGWHTICSSMLELRMSWWQVFALTSGTMAAASLEMSAASAMKHRLAVVWAFFILTALFYVFPIKILQICFHDAFCFCCYLTGLYWLHTISQSRCYWRVGAFAILPSGAICSKSCFETIPLSSGQCVLDDSIVATANPASCEPRCTVRCKRRAAEMRNEPCVFADQLRILPIRCGLKDKKERLGG